MNKVKGASNINPCPECGHTWFLVVEMHKAAWVVVCCNCNTEYIKPLNVAKEAKQLKSDFDETRIPNIDPYRGYK